MEMHTPFERRVLKGNQSIGQPFCSVHPLQGQVAEVSKSSHVHIGLEHTKGHDALRSQQKIVILHAPVYHFGMLPTSVNQSLLHNFRVIQRDLGRSVGVSVGFSMIGELEVQLCPLNGRRRGEMETFYNVTIKEIKENPDTEVDKIPIITPALLGTTWEILASFSS